MLTSLRIVSKEQEGRKAWNGGIKHGSVVSSRPDRNAEQFGRPRTAAFPSAHVRDVYELQAFSRIADKYREQRACHCLDEIFRILI